MRSGKGRIGPVAMGIVCAASMSLGGCGTNGEAPYRSAVTSLEQHGAKIREAFTSGKPEDAHDALHEVGNILDQFPKLIDSTQLSVEDRKAAKQAADELFDAYTELDMSLHDGEKVAYDNVSEKIETNLAILKAKSAAAGASGAPIVEAAHDDHEEHSHDGHDHGDHAHGHDDDHAADDHAEDGHAEDGHADDEPDHSHEGQEGHDDEHSEVEAHVDEHEMPAAESAAK